MVYLLQHLLSESAVRHADRDAIVDGARRLSYAELEALADTLAALLVERGVRRGDRVGICLQKSIESIVAVHAILKAGGVYVPLDANAPPSRLAYIVRNCGIGCLFVSEKTVARVPEMFPDDNPLRLLIVADARPTSAERLAAGVPVIEWSEVLDRPRTAPPANATIDTDLAYILYTSGSTGVPKGVMISHRTSLTFVNWAGDTFRLLPDDRASSHAPLHFDLSIFDMFATFQAGAAMVLVPEGLSTFPVRLADWIAHQRISVWYSVPSVLSMLVLHGRLDRHTFPDLRTVLFAGEVFPVKYLRPLMAAIPQAGFFNLYGPTETNVITYLKVEPLPPDRDTPITIGKACANMDVFALTDEGAAVTRPGEVGELYARGSCLADGYWGDAEKTARSFVDNPLPSSFRERAYKTGDRVTLDDDGNFVFMGRADHMVKSRGYRIELGDVETAIYAHSAIKEAAVVAIPDDVIGNRLVAFVVLNDPGAASADDLQRFCADRIPTYMVPSAFEFLGELPKTSTGKTDRPALVRGV